MAASSSGLLALFRCLRLGGVYGFAAGVSPGPLMGLIVSQTLRSGWRAGCLLSIIPLICEPWIILVAGLTGARLPGGILDGVAMAGGVYVIWTAFSSLSLDPASPARGPAPPIPPGPKGTHGMLDGIVIQVSNPHPYLFWMSVGTPILLRKVSEHGMLGALSFLGGFYGALILSKISIAALVSGSGRSLSARAQHNLLRITGALLMILGVQRLCGASR